MAQIILKEIGTNKVEVMKRFKEVTGVGFKEAEEVVEAVDAGTPCVLGDSISLSEACDIASMFEDDGAIVDVIDDVNPEGNTEVEVYKNESTAVAETCNALPTTPIESMNREETMELLLKVGDIIKMNQDLLIKQATINDEIKRHNIVVDSIRNPRPVKIYVLLGICGLIVMFLFSISIILAIILGIVFFVIIINIGDKDIEEHKDEYEAEAQKYIRDNIEPLKLQLGKVQEEINELNASGQIEWGRGVVGEEFFNRTSIIELYNLIKSRRADNFKEALNVYDSMKHRERMETMQQTIQDASLQAAAEASKQTDAMKEIERNTYSAAKTAKVNAAINYSAYRTAKQLSRCFQINLFNTIPCSGIPVYAGSADD